VRGFALPGGAVSCSPIARRFLVQSGLLSVVGWALRPLWGKRRPGWSRLREVVGPLPEGIFFRKVRRRRSAVVFRWRIRHKLMLGLGVVIGIMALLLAGTLKGLLSYRAAMKAIGSKMAEVKEAYTLHSSVRALLDPGLRDDQEAAELQEKLRQIRQALAAYQDRLADTLRRGRDPDQGYNERAQVQALEKQLQELERALQAASQPQVALSQGSRRLIEDPLVKPHIEELIRTSRDLVDVIIYGNIQDRVNQAQRDFRFCLIFVVATGGGGALLLIWLLRFFYGWVFYPLRDLQEGAVRVAQGDFTHRIEVHSKDEMEDLAAAFNHMMDRLEEIYRDMARQINERSRQLVRSERLAGVGFLAAGVAHEINNPLASIAFCSEALEQRLSALLAAHDDADRPGRPSPQDQEIIKKYLKMIQQEAFRCKEITQRLLEFSRGGERRRELTDLAEIVQNVLEVVQHLQSCKGKHLVFQPNGRPLAWVNAQEIKSVVLNLVANALDSMDEGGTLTITLQQKGDMAELIFADTGCGMTPEVLENIFEPFFTRSRTGKGTGLGLSISHRIISQHGGEIEAFSPGPGQGSTFTVRLPLHPPQTASEESPARPQEADPESYFQDQRAHRRRQAA
jgi:two-component system NtrC family sensor kinase